MYRIILLVAVALTLFAPMASGRCMQKGMSERLSVLRVESCLWRSSNRGSVVTELRETLTNIGDKDIVLELHRTPTTRFHVFISLDGNTESKLPSPPVMDGPDPERLAGYESVPLAAGASIRLSVPIAIFLERPPVPKADYTIGVRHGYSWRYPGEPEGQAFRLRQAEGNQKKSFPKTVWFKVVRLK